MKVDEPQKKPDPGQGPTLALDQDGQETVTDTPSASLSKSAFAAHLCTPCRRALKQVSTPGRWCSPSQCSQRASLISQRQQIVSGVRPLSHASQVEHRHVEHGAMIERVSGVSVRVDNMEKLQLCQHLCISESITYPKRVDRNASNCPGNSTVDQFPRARQLGSPAGFAKIS